MEDNERHNYDQDVIFAYYLKNAWGMELEKVLVINSKENNINYLGEFITIPYDEIEKISNIINNSKLNDIKEIEFPPVLDGTMHEFYFKCNNKVITCYNLWYWNKSNLEDNNNAKILLDIIKSINNILKKYNAEMKLNY